MSVSAHELTQTHFCKFPGCENEASSPVGRYAYCREHQGQSKQAARRNGGGVASADTLAGRIKALSALAAKADRLEAKSRRLQAEADRAALEAGEARDELATQLREVTG